MRTSFATRLARAVPALSVLSAVALSAGSGCVLLLDTEKLQKGDKAGAGASGAAGASGGAGAAGSAGTGGAGAGGASGAAGVAGAAGGAGTGGGAACSTELDCDDGKLCTRDLCMLGGQPCSGTTCGDAQNKKGTCASTPWVGPAVERGPDATIETGKGFGRPTILAAKDRFLISALKKIDNKTNDVLLTSVPLAGSLTLTKQLLSTLLPGVDPASSLSIVKNPKGTGYVGVFAGALAGGQRDLQVVTAPESLASIDATKLTFAATASGAPYAASSATYVPQLVVTDALGVKASLVAQWVPTEKGPVRWAALETTAAGLVAQPAPTVNDWKQSGGVLELGALSGTANTWGSAVIKDGSIQTWHQKSGKLSQFVLGSPLSAAGLSVADLPGLASTHLVAFGDGSETTGGSTHLFLTSCNDAGCTSGPIDGKDEPLPYGIFPSITLSRAKGSLTQAQMALAAVNYGQDAAGGATYAIGFLAVAVFDLKGGAGMPTQVGVNPPAFVFPANVLSSPALAYVNRSRTAVQATDDGSVILLAWVEADSQGVETLRATRFTVSECK